MAWIPPTIADSTDFKIMHDTPFYIYYYMNPYVSWQIGLDTETVISPLIFSRDEIENSPFRLSSIVQNILREGIAI